MAATTPLQKGSELVQRAIAADTGHKYEEALALYEQAIEFLRQAIALETNVPSKEGITGKVAEYEHRVASIKKALGHPAGPTSSLPSMPSAPQNAPISASNAPPSSVPPPSAAKPYAPPYAPPQAFAPAPQPAPAPSQPAAYPYPAAPPQYAAAPGYPPPGYPSPGYPQYPAPPGYPPQYPYPAPPPSNPYPYPYPYPYPAAPPAQASPSYPAVYPNAGAGDSSQVPLGSFIGAFPGAPTTPPMTLMQPMQQPMPPLAAPIYSSPLVNTLGSRPQAMADHSSTIPAAGRPATGEITHGTWDGGQIRLRAETPSDAVGWGSQIRVRVTIMSSGSHKIDHIRMKLKGLDDTYRQGQKERRATLMSRDYWDGMPMRHGDYDREMLFQLPNFRPYAPKVTYYLAVSLVMGVLVKNLRVRLVLRFVS